MNNFTLYEIKFTTDRELNLLDIAESFSCEAEIENYDRSSARITLRLVSELNESQIERICDDFKIQIESNHDVRLIYKVSSIAL